MEVNVREDRRLVEVWLTNAEKDDPALRETLGPLYAAYKERRYTVAVYESGTHDLYESTLALLLHNRMRSAEAAARQPPRHG